MLLAYRSLLRRENSSGKKFCETWVLSASTHSPLQHHLLPPPSLICLYILPSYSRFQSLAVNPPTFLSRGGNSGHPCQLPWPQQTSTAIDRVTQCTVKGEHFLQLRRGSLSGGRGTRHVTDTGWQTLWTQTTGNECTAQGARHEAHLNWHVYPADTWWRLVRSLGSACDYSNLVGLRRRWQLVRLTEGGGEIHLRKQWCCNIESLIGVRYVFHRVSSQNNWPHKDPYDTETAEKLI